MTVVRSFVSLLLLGTALSSSALAEAPSVASWAERRIADGLLRPLARKDEDRSKFSRARMPPRERRTRVLADTLSRDAKNRGFVSFVIDVRYGDEWTENVTGCVYEGSGAIYVAVGDEYRPAAFLLGKKAEAVSGVCVAISPAS